MNILLLVAGIVLAYLLGSIPTSVWIGRVFFKKDVRHYGSGNAGATNTMRTLGWKAGVCVLVFDVLKGMLAVFLSDYFIPDHFTYSQLINYNVICAITAVIGHIYPVFAGFKGGKGVATLAGIMFALLPIQTSGALIVFVIVMFLSGYVSLSSIITALSYPIIVAFVSNIPFIKDLFITNFPSLKPIEFSEIIFSIAIAVFIPITHLKNIKRLLEGKEKKLFRKKQ
jgi:glycerol-3-phosphate acyltransferase PlsY